MPIDEKRILHRPWSKSELRSRAESIVSAEPIPAGMTPDQLAELARELRVHQVELRLQNESLMRTHAELESLHGHFVDLYDRAPVAYVSADETGTITRANETLGLLLQVARGSVVGSRLERWCVEPDAYYLHCRALTKEDGHVRNDDLKANRADGSKRVLSVTSRYRPGDSDPIRSVMVDVTDIRRAESQVQSTERLIALGRLSGNIAHEFNNILSIIMAGADDLLQDLAADDPHRQNASEVLTASERARDVIAQLMAFAHQREDDLNLGPVNIRATVVGGLRLVRAMLPSNIALELRAPDRIPSVLANETQVTQVLLNLCTNARDAIGEGDGHVVVALQPLTVNARNKAQHPQLDEGDYVTLSVQDDGCGISEVDQAKVFDPYYTTKPEGQGSGIGMTIVASIARRHRGSVSIESESGVGTRVAMCLRALDQASSTPSPAKPTPAPTGVEHILLVDDEEMLIGIQKRQLTRLGYDVTAEVDPQRALRRFRADPSRFALLMTDLTMPGLTGLQLAAECRRLRPDLPVILMSGFPDASAADGDLGAPNAFLAKPIAGVELARQTRRVLDQASTLQNSTSEDAVLTRDAPSSPTRGSEE